MRWMPLSFMPAVGIGMATTALVGRYLGQGRPDIGAGGARTRPWCWRCCTWASAGWCSCLPPRAGERASYRGADARHPREELVRQAAEIIRIGGYVMICAAVFQLFDAVGIVFIGALRGAGDTFWPMIFTVLLSWGLIVGGGYLMTQAFPQLRSIGPWMAASLYVVALGPGDGLAVPLGRMARIDLLHRGPEAPAGPPPPIPPAGPPIAS